MIRNSRTTHCHLLIILVANLIAAAAGRISNDDWVVLNPGEFPGIRGQVNALAKYRENIYVAGNLIQAGNVDVNGIARWDGHIWSALGTGLRGSIQSPAHIWAIACDSNGNVFAAGDFDTAGSVYAPRIAKWNGQEWSSLNSKDKNINIYALACDDAGNLYAGGHFDSIDVIRANGVAKWNGSSWVSMETGPQLLVVNTILCRGASVFIGGDFDTVGTACAGLLAEWDGNTWRAVGSGFDGRSPNYYQWYVRALACGKNGSLYAGGHFDSVGGIAASNIAEWDGGTWKPVGTGLGSFYYNTRVTTLACTEAGELFAGGDFNAGSRETPSLHAARWNGRFWNTLGSGFDSAVYISAMIPADSGMIVGGSFIHAGGVPACNIARWDGVRFNALGSGLDREIFAIAAADSGAVYIGGAFSTIGGKSIRNVACLRNGVWDTVGSGLGGAVLAMACGLNGSLYAGGGTLFSEKTLTGSLPYAFGFYNGKAWARMGAYNDMGAIRSLTRIDSTRVLAGGAPGYPVRNPGAVGIWNGTGWDSLGRGVRCANYDQTPIVYATARDGLGNIYAGGIFDSAGGCFSRNVARWDGNEWQAMGNGIRAKVCALACDGSGTVYAGGEFDTASGWPCRFVARWDGVSWSPLATGVDNIVTALACDGSGILYAGGVFDSSGGTPANRIAQWDGAGWNTLGDGVDGTITALTIKDSKLYVGGNFRSAGGKMSPGVAAVSLSGPARTRSRRIPAAGRGGFRFRTGRSSIFINDITPIDIITLYTVSGRMIRSVAGAPVIDLSGISQQSLVLQIKRAGKAVHNGMIVR